MTEPVFAPELVMSASGPLIRLELGPDRRPVGAVAALKIAATPARVWDVVTDLARFPERVPMIHRVKLEGDRVAIQLRFKVALFSAGFGFTADVVREEGRGFELRYVSGEPRAMHLRFDLLPVADGRATLAYAAVSFDIHSLGWLVKFFLKHHPEIQYGVFPGSALVLLDGIRRAAEV